jgi:hypothetical protein
MNFLNVTKIMTNLVQLHFIFKYIYINFHSTFYAVAKTSIKIKRIHLFH